MRLLDIRLRGPILLEPAVQGDGRGFFLQSYRANVWAQHSERDRQAPALRELAGELPF